MKSRKARLIAFYLPQFHPIPENDLWWGPGFTEWTHVRRARPLFPGHRQPLQPGELGSYDLRDPQTRAAQAKLAEEHGVEAFCYWHYWFAGRRLLETPFRRVLESGTPPLSFCLGWANHDWLGTWVGASERILMRQTYPGPEDEEAHFQAVLPAFRDPRHLRVEGKPVFLVCRPMELPEPVRFTERWRRLAEAHGLPGLFLLAVAWNYRWSPEDYGFDGAVVTNPGSALSALQRSGLSAPERLVLGRTGWNLRRALRSVLRRPEVIPYERYVRTAFPPGPLDDRQYPCVAPNWDNTPRCGFRGLVLLGSTPELFQIHLARAAEKVSSRDPDHRLVFVKSWNEWGEGNYLEPDRRFGRSYLEVTRKLILG